MSAEIERKFLVRDSSWKEQVSSSTEFRQRYVSTTGEAHRTIRLRLAGEKAFLTLKTEATGLIRGEYEYEIPYGDGMEIFQRICDGPAIEKVRHLVAFGGKQWEIDEFLGDNAGLVVAEIELESPDEPFPRPPWLGREVTEDHRYANSSLTKNPFQNWKC